jgi:GNAT superfamily N-acetyltransferase
MENPQLNDEPSPTLHLITAWDDERVRELNGLYHGEWWSSGRTLEDVRRMVAASSVVVGLADRGTGRLAAFARVVTDGVFKALIFDVIVAPAFRGRGVGAALMDAVLAHPELRGVRHVELYCLPEMVPFYRRWGFSDDLGGVVLMRRDAM